MTLLFGFPTWMGNIHEGLADKLADIRGHGIGLLELSLEYPWPYSHTGDLDVFLNKTRETGFTMGIHAPWRDVPLASPYDAMDNALLKIILDSAEYIVKRGINPEYIVLHPSTMQKIELFDNRRDIVGKLRNRIERLLERLEIPLLLENLTRGFASEVSHLIESIDGLDGAGICLDVGHLAARYNRELREHYQSFYDYLEEVVNMLSGTRVPVLHIHDVDRLNHEHLLIGEGVLEFKRIYKIVSRLRPRFIIFEIFKSRKGAITLEKILGIIGDQASWARIYIH